MKGLILLVLVLLACLIFMTGSVLGDVVTWDGSTDGDGDGIRFDDPNNWNTNSVPGVLPKYFKSIKLLSYKKTSNALKLSCS